MKIGLLIIAVIIAVFFAVASYVCNTNSIKEWAIENKYTLIEYEECFFDLGPFDYIGKGRQVYKVKVKNSNGEYKIFYFRFNIIDDTQIIEYKN